MNQEAYEAFRINRHIAVGFAEVRKEHEATIFMYVSRRVRPVEEAEDVAASVFVDAYHYWPQRKGQPKLWLLGIARRKVANWLRKNKPCWELREEILGADGFTTILHREEVQQALAILQKMPVNERDVFLLQTLEELSIEEISQVIGRTPKATNSLLGRAKTRLRHLVRLEGETA